MNDNEKKTWRKDEDPLCDDSVRNFVSPGENTEYVADKKRWYLLSLHIFAGIMSTMMWNMWPPIQETCQLVFNWTDENILLIGVITSFTGAVFLIPCSWLLNRKGELTINLQGDVRGCCEWFVYKYTNEVPHNERELNLIMHEAKASALRTILSSLCG